LIYRQLGNTGLTVSQLGFGAMRLPMAGEGTDARVDRELAIPMIHRAFEAGVNYIDTAVGYCQRDSQRAVGEALKGWRDRIVVSTKNPYYGEQETDWWQNLEDSLERLQVECIDVYNHHGMNRKRWQEWGPRLSRWMHKARDRGLIKHICCSFHDSNEFLEELIDTGYPEVITLQYNMLDTKLERGIARAAERGVGIVVMGPVGGGRLGVRSEVMGGLLPGVQRVPELALRFVLSNPDISVALSGMSTMQHVEENVRVAADQVSLTPEDRQAIQEHLQRLGEMSRLYCTGCGYCLPCPEGVAIPQIFELYNYGRVYGLWQTACERYGRIGSNPRRPQAKADGCVECGACEEKCPQNIPIREQLKEAHAELAARRAAAKA